MSRIERSNDERPAPAADGRSTRMMSTHTDHDRNRRRFGKADDELVGFFSAAIGVRAQNLDSNGGAFNSHDAHEGRLKAMAWLTGRVGAREWFDRVGSTLVQLPLEHRRLVVLVYTPHGAPTWLADALSTPWGGGSFVQLACALPRATLAAADRHGGAIAWPKRGVVRAQPRDGQTVLDWLVARGRRAKDALLSSLREDGEALRMPALAAYEQLRIERVKAEQIVERDTKAARERANEDRYLKWLGKRRRGESDRLTKRQERMRAAKARAA